LVRFFDFLSVFSGSKSCAGFHLDGKSAHITSYDTAIIATAAAAAALPVLEIYTSHFHYHQYQFVSSFQFFNFDLI